MSLADITDQLTLLNARGYVGLTLTESEIRRREARLPPRSVVVTFDDAFASIANAVPVMEELGFPGTVFVVTAFADDGAHLRWPGVEHWTSSPFDDEMRSLDWGALRSLVARGWEVGSHTVSHASLPGLNDAALRAELIDSRAAIMKQLGSCAGVAYPYGHADARVGRAAAGAGYLVGCTLTAAHDVDEALLRPRTGLYPKDGRLRTRAKLSPTTQRLRRTRLAGTLAGVRRQASNRSRSR